MKTSELLSATGETVEYAKQYIRQQIEYFQLGTTEKIAKTTASLITISILAVSVLMIVLFLSVALGFYLGALLNSNALAFLIVSGLYLLLTLIMIFFRKSIITKPIVNLIIKEMMD